MPGPGDTKMTKIQNMRWTGQAQPLLSQDSLTPQPEVEQGLLLVILVG